MNYALDLVVQLEIYLILALSLNLIVGYGGMLSLAHAALQGLGAYFAALLALRAGLGFVPATLIACVGTAVASLAVAYPSLRLRGDYFILASLAFQTIVVAVLRNAVDWTGGPFGVRGIPRPTIAGIAFDSLGSFCALSTLVAGAVVILLGYLGQAPFGRALIALRDDPLATQTLGKDIVGLKVWAFAVSGSLAALAGSLYAAYIGYIDPSVFTLDRSIFLLATVLVGGAGTRILGPIIGTLLLAGLLPEVLRFAGLPSGVAFYGQRMLYGLLLILLMRYQPQGLVGDLRFDR